MEKFTKYMELLEGEIPGVAGELGEFKDQASREAMSFITESKQDLIKWTSALTSGQLSAADFEWLLKSKKDLLKLNGLKAAGLAHIQADKFRDQVLSLVIDKASNHF